MSNKKKKFADAFDDVPTTGSIPQPDQVYPSPVKMVPTRSKTKLDSFGHNTKVVDGKQLTIPNNINEDQWKEIGINIRQQTDKIQWVIGDWMLFAERQWGDGDVDGKRSTRILDIAEEVTNYSRRSLKRFKNMSEFYDGVKFLRWNCAYSLHVVIFEEVDETVRNVIANDILKEATEHKWSKRKLYEELQQEKPAIAESVETDTQPSRIPSAKNRFDKHITKTQFNRMSSDEQVDFANWMREKSQQVDGWLDDQ